jgi:histidinol phosphatase-like enzyme (inositol monophosphatase family)
MSDDACDAADLLAFSHQLADRAGEAILPYFRASIAVEDKAAGGAFDPVTAADRAAEQVISAALQDRYPDHGLIGEEYGRRDGSSRYRWVVDPIDGTKAFILGLPIWGTLIGLLDGAQPVLGMMDQPYTRERFWSDGSASFLSVGGSAPRLIRTRPCKDIGQAMLSTTHPDLFAAGAEAEAFARIKQVSRMTRYGGDCYAYCLLAAGFIDLVVEAGLKPHDIVALIPIIERAGGVITTWDGKSATSGGRILASGDPVLHEKAMKVLAGA